MNALHALAALLLSSPALATELDRFPLQATVDLPADGITAVQIPATLRSPLDPADGTDLLLVDAEGSPVQVAWLRGSPGDPETIDAFDDSFHAGPKEVGVWRIQAAVRPADALRIAFVEVPTVATAQLMNLDGTPAMPPVTVWQTDWHAEAELPLPPQTGTWTLRLTTTDGTPLTPASVDGLRWERPPVPDLTWTVPVTSARLSEDGNALYDLALPSPAPIRGVRILPTDDIFDRIASLYATPALYDGYPSRSDTPVRAIRFGDTTLTRTFVPMASEPSDLLTLEISTNGRPLLDVPQVEVVMDGMSGIVRDPGPGPHTLYAGAPPDTAPRWDLAIAAPELARAVAATVQPGDVSPNPAFVPPEVRAGLVDAGPAPVLRGYRYTRALTGPAGPAHVILDHPMLAQAGRRLRNLRVLDAEGRQLPYLLRRRTGDHVWTDLPTRRVEDGATSLIEVTLPAVGVPVSTVTLTSPATVFSRRVTVSEPTSSGSQTLRRVQWHADDRPGTLTLSVDQTLGDRLIVGIDNGDNPPLPVDDITVGWPTWELRTTLPEGGATLLYGGTGAGIPDYDLTLLRQEVFSRPSSEAQLGEPEPWAGPPQTAFDRTAIGVGMLGFGGGLLMLVVALVRAKPEEDAPAA